MFVAVLLVVFALSLLLVRWERVGALGPAPSTAIVALAWVCAFIPPFAVMQWFLGLWIAVGGSLLLAASVLLLRHRGFAGPVGSVGSVGSVDSVDSVDSAGSAPGASSGSAS